MIYYQNGSTAYLEWARTQDAVPECPNDICSIPLTDPGLYMGKFKLIQGAELYSAKTGSNPGCQECGAPGMELLDRQLLWRWPLPDLQPPRPLRPGLCQVPGQRRTCAAVAGVCSAWPMISARTARPATSPMASACRRRPAIAP